MITDRTQLDVDRWKELRDKGWASMTEAERTEWMGEMKGRYAYTDMNRVEAAVKAVSEEFVEKGYIDTPLTVKTNWTVSDSPTRADMERYIGNIATLRKSIRVYPTTPLAPSISDQFDFKIANDLEKILVDLADILTKIDMSWYYAGELYSGEV